MKLTIKNFRSIRSQAVDLAPITVVYGPNSSGKSSLLYTLLTLKNIVLNPNQQPAAFFNYNFLNIGGFEQAVFDHNVNLEMSIGIELATPDGPVSYNIALKGTSGHFTLSIPQDDRRHLSWSMGVSYPYSMNTRSEIPHPDKIEAGVVNWNGVSSQVVMKHPNAEAQQHLEKLAARLNVPAERARRIDVVPLKRGFTKPQYSVGTTVPIPVTEDEMATWLYNNQWVEDKVSVLLESIFSRDFRVRSIPNTGFFSLKAVDKATGVGSELVNEGFGVNQMVYFLARCLAPATGLVCVEEPEIHLHPSAVRKVARTLPTIMTEEDKQFLISTQSETFVLALLALVAEGRLKRDQVAFYLVQKERKETRFERQDVNEHGQVSGGLASFMEGELEDVRTFLAADK